MPLIPSLLLCILISYLFALLAYKVKMPHVIGLILAGILLGSTSLNEVIIGDNIEAVQQIGQIGFLTLMFLAGFEISWCMLFKERKDAIFVALFASILPLIIAIAVIQALGFSLHAAVAVGICMSITAEATKATVLLELKKLKTKLGAILMGSGILEEILGLILFMLLVFWVTGDFVANGFSHLFFALGLFVVGIFIHRHLGRENHAIKSFEKWSFVLIVPFFFISMGEKFSLDAIIGEPWLVLVIFGIAFIGKMGGTFLTKPFIKDLSWSQLFLVGWGMNSRGTIEIAIAFIALELGILPANLYSSIVLTVLISIVLFPIVVRQMVKKDKRIMDR